MNDAKYDKAVEAFDKVIRTYPASNNVPELRTISRASHFEV